MSKVKKNISLEEDILTKGLIRAKELGYNFSSYVTYLINEDSNNFNTKDDKVTQIKNDKTSDNKVSSKIMSGVDDILNKF